VSSLVWLQIAEGVGCRVSSPLNLAGRPWPARSSSARYAIRARALHMPLRGHPTTALRSPCRLECAAGEYRLRSVYAQDRTVNDWAPACAGATGGVVAEEGPPIGGPSRRMPNAQVRRAAPSLTKLCGNVRRHESRWWADAEAAWSAELSHGWFSAARLAERPYRMYGRTAPAHRPTAGSSALSPNISA
jgi:hypothetical protein